MRFPKKLGEFCSGTRRFLIYKNTSRRLFAREPGLWRLGPVFVRVVQLT